MKSKKIIYLGIALISILLISAIIKSMLIKEDKNNDKNDDISAWIVDWCIDDGIKEVNSLESNLNSIQVFGAYFNDKDEVFVSEDILNKDFNIQKDLYLTVVNDIIYENKKPVQKDTELISRILSDDEKRNKHINELIDLVNKYEFDGLELDYEKIDSNLWDEYILFIDDLGQLLSKNNKKLRVVLEPSSPFDEFDMPSEYEYVVMAYNLYGYGTGPGPKADKSFIKTLSKKSVSNLENVRIAFSLGGFDWNENEESPKALTKPDIDKIITEYNININRDEKSGANYFYYYDLDNVKHTVWYSDEETIKTWMDTSKEEGVNKFALWRLGNSF